MRKKNNKIYKTQGQKKTRCMQLTTVDVNKVLKNKNSRAYINGKSCDIHGDDEASYKDGVNRNYWWEYQEAD